MIIVKGVLKLGENERQYPAEAVERAYNRVKTGDENKEDRRLIAGILKGVLALMKG